MRSVGARRRGVGERGTEGVPWRVDAAAAGAVFVLGLVLWALDRGQAPELLPAGAPFWARFEDYLLSGPDAGAWAHNVLAVWLGSPADLQPHRLPTMPRLAAPLVAVTGDVALAGHLLNHLAAALVGPVLYLLGRGWMSRGMAFGAAVVTACLPSVDVAGDAYGVDALVMALVPGALLAAEAAARRVWLAPVAGLVLALAAGAHLTTLGMPVAATALYLTRSPSGPMRWPGALGIGGGFLVGTGLLFLDYPMLSWAPFLESISQGVVAPHEWNAANVTTERAAAVVGGGATWAAYGVLQYLSTSLRTPWLVWQVAGAICVLGVVGPGLEGPPPARRARGDLARWAMSGLAVGVPLAIALAPLLAFAAADSPLRYSHNFLPLAILLLARGLDSLLRVGEGVLRAGVPEVPEGALGVAGGAIAALLLVDPAYTGGPSREPPSAQSVAEWRTAQVVLANFPPEAVTACTGPEIAALAGRLQCPNTGGSRIADMPRADRMALSNACAGEGDIPYVVLLTARDERTESRKKLDAWVASGERLVDVVVAPDFEARVYAVRRFGGARP